MWKTIIATVIFFTANQGFAQKITVEQYIDTYKGMAIAEMKRVGMPASIILAQGILETESGNSVLVKMSNNHFGIKCKSTWTGMSVKHTDDAPNECFRKYPSAEDSYKDHSDYLFNTPRYAFLFQLSSSDYKGWAYGLKKAGYATNPRYPEILITNIEKYNLQQYNNPADENIQSGEVTILSPQVNKTQKAEAEPEQPAVFEQPKQSVQAETRNRFENALSLKKNSSHQYLNSLKAVLAIKGVSLLAIAFENDIPLAKLLDYNDLVKDGIVKTDQWIYLEKKRKEGNRDIYTALKTESLYEISQNNAVQLSSLAQYNQLSQDCIVKVGTKVKLRPFVKDVSQTTTSSSALKIHEVQPKEGLYGIAKKYNITVDEIKEWNQLSGTDLKMGQQLIIAK